MEGQPMNKQHEPLSGNDAAASLAFATQLHENMAKQPEEDAQEPQNTPEEPKEQKPTDMQDQIKSAVDEQLGSLRKEIEKALSEDTKEDKQETSQIDELKSMFTDFVKESKSRNEEMDSFRADLKSILNDK